MTSLPAALGSKDATAARTRANVSLLGRGRGPAAALAIAFVAMLVVALLQGPKLFYYDSGVYWSLAETFKEPHGFSLLNFNSPLRGYLLPLVNLGLQEIANALVWNHSSLAKIFNALVLASIATVLAPKLAELAWPEQRWGLWRRLGLAALVIVFWRGYLNFPLSDFPALAAVLLTLTAIVRPDRPGWMLVAGLTAGAAIDMRPAYVLLMPVVAALVLLPWWQMRGKPHASAGRRVLCVGLLVGGFVAISLPQSLATHRHYGVWSFIPGTAARLTSLQYTEGTRLQRYDTYVGSGKPSPQMFFVDETGTKLLNEQEGGVIRTTQQYLGLVATHPATMSGLFARHVVNGLDQRYSTPYIEHLDTGGNRWLRLSGFVLVFLALIRVAWPAARRSLGRACWRLPAALLVAGATSLASAVEARFLLPASLLSYVLVLAPGWPSPFASAETGLRRLRTPVVLLAAFVVFIAVVLSVIGNATQQLRFG